MFIVGSAWVGTAAKLGNGHMVFWLAAMAMFYLPQAAVVIYLNRLMPLEGGLYQWATVGFGKFGGFVTAWNLWAFAILILATFGVQIATILKYRIGNSIGVGRVYDAITNRRGPTDGHRRARRPAGAWAVRCAPRSIPGARFRSVPYDSPARPTAHGRTRRASRGSANWWLARTTRFSRTND